MSILICTSLSFSKTAFAQTSVVKVDIVFGASTKSGPQAFSMDPIKVSVGETVGWINKDAVDHALASGTPGSPDAGRMFKTDIRDPTEPSDGFGFKFTKAGTFPYFCQFHPNMTGTVIVS